MKTKKFITPVKVVGFVTVALGLIAVFGLVIQLLWNGIMPGVFGLREISYLQAFGLLLLCRILLGGFGSGSKNNKHISA